MYKGFSLDWGKEDDSLSWTDRELENRSSTTQPDQPLCPCT